MRENFSYLSLLGFCRYLSVIGSDTDSTRERMLDFIFPQKLRKISIYLVRLFLLVKSTIAMLSWHSDLSGLSKFVAFPTNLRRRKII